MKLLRKSRQNVELRNTLGKICSTLCGTNKLKFIVRVSNITTLIDKQNMKHYVTQRLTKTLIDING